MTSTTLPRRPSTRQRKRPNLQPLITRMSYPLAPLHPLPNGAPHPNFPLSILSYHLLTEAECDSIARYYHQWVSSPCIWTTGYPAIMNWDHEFLEHLGWKYGVNKKLDVKRRKIGRFIGLRGCETPTDEQDERERWWEARERILVKSQGYFFGRRGWGQW